MIDKKKQALEVYMSGTATQTQIATQVGISERTLYSWIKDNGWDRLRQASLAAPIMIADELCTQLINLQRSIAAREEGQQFPTLQEANITGKLIMSLSRLKNFPSISQSLQILQAFRHYVRDRNKDAAWQVGHYMESFLEDRAKFGFVPSQPEYGINPVNPFEAGSEHMSPPLGGGRVGHGNSEPEIPAAQSAQIPENKETAENNTSFRHQQEPASPPELQRRKEIFGNSRPHSSTMPGPDSQGWAHEMTDTLNNIINCEAPVDKIEQSCVTGNFIPETVIKKPAQVTENKEVTQETTYFCHQQEPEISGNLNPQLLTPNSQPPIPNPLTITVNWEDGPNPLPSSVIFTLPDGKQEEVPFAGLVEAQVKRSIGNQHLTPELYEAHRKAAETTLATNFMDKRYGRQDQYRKAS